ncbi:MarR family transcriptional regulator [Sphaerisporangium sp. NPDC005289]|uniref:MarR family winged helix-turn-helix transcriptional regulator n=1 Tax=Sphaerisporangium sp. NPDC005289 TaxID=3155247 RepID=UPI0033AEECE6
MATDFQTAFWTAKRAMALASEAAYNRHGVRSGQQFILRCLWENDGMAPGEIARLLELSTPTVTRAATRMEAAGLLRREPHPTDARLVRLLLTDRGRELESVIDEEMARLSERALRTLDAAEREQFLRFLGEIRQNLT